MVTNWTLLCVFRAYFVAVAVSGIFAVTFSIVFAYVADCTTENERGCSYGMVRILGHVTRHSWNLRIVGGGGGGCPL